MEEELVGKVTHYFSKIGVAAVKLTKPIKVGERLHFKGATTDFEDTVSSMQIGHRQVSAAKKGEEVGLKVSDRVREGDKVYRPKE
jgi:putative protease